MTRYAPGTSLPWDWHPGTIPWNARIDRTAYVETTHSFSLNQSRKPKAIWIGRGAGAYRGTMFDLGPQATVHVGRYTLLTGVRIICDSSIEIGDFAMLSWNVVLMDTRRASLDPEERRHDLRQAAGSADRRLSPDRATAQPIKIGANVWIGFDAVVMPGVTIGDNSIVGAKSVVCDDVEPGTIVAGNPARLVRHLQSTAASDD